MVNKYLREAEMNRVMNAIIQVAFDREMDLHVSVVIIG
jgi:hypothetical protein